MTNNLGITFLVDEVEPVLSKLPTIPYGEQFKNLIGKELEDCSQNSNDLISSKSNSFIYSLYLSFSQHRPIIISPDDIWLLICQGFANHINVNSEKFRELLVYHKGKDKLIVYRDDFIKGEKNPWHEVIEKFSIKIKNKTKIDIYDIIVSNFSTSNSQTKTAFEITLMNTMESYFEYELNDLCGIPSITLMGNKDDYLKITNNLNFMSSFELLWWTDPLKEIIDEFINVFDGKVNLLFWKSIFKHIPRNNNSGSVPTANGWCNIFFPYYSQLEKNYIDHKVESSQIKLQKNEQLIIALHEFKINSYKIFNHSKNNFSYAIFGSGLNKADFIWIYKNATYEMELYSGFIGAFQEPETKAIKLQIGWAVSEKSNKMYLECSYLSDYELKTENDSPPNEYHEMIRSDEMRFYNENSKIISTNNRIENKKESFFQKIISCFRKNKI